MTNIEQPDPNLRAIEHPDPKLLLEKFTDSGGACFYLKRSRQTLCDMVERGAIRRYRRGTAVLYYLPEVLALADVLRRLDDAKAAAAVRS